MSDSAQIVTLDPPAAPTPASDGSMRFKLKRPIPAHGGPISEIRLREPVADDYFNLPPITRGIVHGEVSRGVPAKTELSLDGAAIRQWISRLSGLDAGVIGQIKDISDILRMTDWLNEKLGRDQEATAAD